MHGTHSLLRCLEPAKPRTKRVEAMKLPIQSDERSYLNLPRQPKGREGKREEERREEWRRDLRREKRDEEKWWVEEGDTRAENKRVGGDL